MKYQLTTREFYILAILYPDDCYGREIRDEYEEITKERMPLGSLYVTLARMEDKGLIRSRTGIASPLRGGNRRKYFSLTDAGTVAFTSLRNALGGIA